MDLGDILSGQAFVFVLVMCRTGAAVMLLPAFGENELPTVSRVGIALWLAVLLVPTLPAPLPVLPDSPVGLARDVIAEVLVGSLLGWLARLVSLALSGTGQLISLSTGLSSVIVADATLGVQASSLGRMFGLAAPALLLASGLYALPLSALAESYAVLPAGGSLGSGDLAEVAVRAVGRSFELSVRLASPFILISVLWQVALGLLSRLVPQLQIYFAALPGQVLGGLMMIALLSRVLLETWSDAARVAFSALPGS